jgi:Lon protease-like protein
MRSPVQTTYDDLPNELPIFPLSGALLLPWGRLPLNIFEPRYLNMTLDALKQGRVIGMVQPNLDRSKPALESPKAEPVLYLVGCAGRIASFEETEDGRLLIVLRGLVRFRIEREIEGRSGYRRVIPHYESFKSDLDVPSGVKIDRPLILERLKAYLDVQGLPITVDVIQGLSDATLVNSLCMMCPFDPREKQMLLECADIATRAETLAKLLQIGMFDIGAAGTGAPQ